MSKLKPLSVSDYIPYYRPLHRTTTNGIEFKIVDITKCPNKSAYYANQPKKLKRNSQYSTLNTSRWSNKLLHKTSHQNDTLYSLVLYNHICIPWIFSNFQTGMFYGPTTIKTDQFWVHSLIRTVSSLNFLQSVVLPSIIMSTRKCVL